MFPQVLGQSRPFSELYLGCGVRAFLGRRGGGGGNTEERRGTDRRCVSFFSTSVLKHQKQKPLEEEAVYFG